MKKIPFALLFRYLLAGITGLIVNVGILYICTEYFHIWYLISASIAFCIATTVSFILQKFWTFQNHTLEKVHNQMIIFVLLAVFNIVLNSGILYVLVTHFHVWYILGQIVSSGLVALESLLIYKYIIFHNRPHLHETTSI